MSVWLWVAAAWVATTCIIAMLFFGAKRSAHMYRWLFGAKPGANVRHLAKPQARDAAEPITRLAA